MTKNNFKIENLLLCQNWIHEAHQNLINLDQENNFHFLKNAEVWFHQKNIFGSVLQKPINEIKGLIYFFFSHMYDQKDQLISDKFLLKYFKKCALSSFGDGDNSYSNYEVNEIHIAIEQIIQYFNPGHKGIIKYLNHLPMKEKLLFVFYHEVGHFIYGKKIHQRKDIIERYRLQEKNIRLDENYLEVTPLLEENTFLPYSLIDAKNNLLNFWSINLKLTEIILNQEINGANIIEEWDKQSLEKKQIYIYYILLNEMYDWFAESYSDCFSILLNPFDNRDYLVDLIISARIKEYEDWLKNIKMIKDPLFANSIGMDHYTIHSLSLIKQIKDIVLKHKTGLSLKDYDQMDQLATIFGLAKITVPFIANYRQTIYYLFSKYQNQIFDQSNILYKNQFLKLLEKKENFSNQVLISFAALLDKKWVNNLDADNGYKSNDSLFYIPNYLLKNTDTYYQTIYKPSSFHKNINNYQLFKLLFLSNLKII